MPFDLKRKQFIMKNSIFIIVVFLICLGYIHGWKVKLCEHKNYKGRCGYLAGNDCRNIDEMKWCNGNSCKKNADKKVSSIKLYGSCIQLYKDRDCEGSSKKIRSGLWWWLRRRNLRRCDFNDKASSVGPC